MITSISIVQQKLDRVPKAYKQTKEDLEELNDPENAAPKYKAIIEASDDSIEMFQLDEEDTVMCCCRAGHLGSVDMIVYNPVHQEFFFHHGMELPFLPLSATSFAFTPQSERAEGAYIAITGFSSEIEIYNLNEMDQIRPDCVLAQGKYIKKTQTQINNPIGHKGDVIGSTWSQLHPNIIATCSSDASVKFWDLAGLSCLTTLENVHVGGINNILFCETKEQTFITSGLADQSIKLFDFTQQLDFIKQVNIGKNIEQVRFFGDLLLATTEDGYLALVDILQEKVLQIVQIYKDVPITALTTRANLIVAGSPESHDIKVLKCVDNQLVPVTEFNISEPCFSAEFGIDKSGFMLFCGLGNNRMKAINIFAKLTKECVHEVFGVDRAQFLKFKDLSLNLEGEGGDDDSDVE
ncbi:WD40_repeat protein [Hexamita inflata]|uniref:WD40 repeat protein n=1 Tax=Hexamita inflata TaxID=28002 RepID=A0AA86V0U9_9EUKA|nr:WD40 repeat protein [Hexamita inflata]CAI9976134.1 WD40 repeat protein [Hexamita inflata]